MKSRDSLKENEQGRLKALKYTQKDLVSIARRENNKMRNYLVVNPLQGKHIPVSPGRALELFGQLAEQIKNIYGAEKLLLIGFAETATAIGAHVASLLGAMYMQTTRETVPGADYLFFSEAHSHATEQKLVKNDMDRMMPRIERIIFIEDEVTTGNTILDIINVLERTYPYPVGFSVASLLNGMKEEYVSAYEKRKIALHYIIKTDHHDYPETAEKFEDNGIYMKPDTEGLCFPEEVKIAGWMDARRAVDAKRYQAACEGLWNAAKTRIKAESGKKYLVMGTEEFMYPALYIGKKLEELGADVRSHSTTRSPIMVSRDEGYPLWARYELRSLYDRERVTYLYNLDRYDGVIILTDSHNTETEGIRSLYNAVRSCNDNIMIIRWC